MSNRLIALGFAAIVAAPLILLSATKKDAPAELNLTDLNGKKVHLRDYRGKIIVLNFWATWCGPCQEEMPMFVQVEKEWTPKGVMFIGASLDDKKTQKNIPDFVEKFKIDFSIWTGLDGDGLYKLDMGEAVPDTAFLNEQGIVFSRVLGEIKKPELIERLAWITSDRSGPAPAPLVRNLPPPGGKK